MEQRSKEWFEARRGRFTASQVYRLLGKINKDGTLAKMTQQSIDTFAFEMAVETIYGCEPEEEFLPKDMQRGIDLEPRAFELFQTIKEKEFIEVNDCSFFKYSDNGGASPDGLVGDTAILEIKCPKRNKFFKYVANGSKEIDLQYMAQMQKQMLATDRGSGFFFNYYIEDGKEFHHTIEVQRDDEMIDLIKERLEVAEEIKQAYIYSLKKNKQF